MTDPAAPIADRKRILALDGGGVRGVFSVEILARMEQLLRDHLGRPQLVLADHFQFMAGTSTGAIIATLLSWGEPVQTIRQLYHDRCEEIFPKHAPWKVWKLPLIARSLYSSEALSTFLRGFFHDESTRAPALLGTNKLKTLLLVCMRNATTGSAWPITNNPKATYNKPDLPDCNLNIPLWQLVRASTAAPVYFRPEKIAVGSTPYEFMDGGITPYNNPALIAFLTATLPCYHMNWPIGTDRLRIVSVGTGRVRTVLRNESMRSLNIGTSLISVPPSLMETVSQQQDFLCRILGNCLFGEEIDGEIGHLIASEQESSADKKFSYVRYDHHFTHGEVADAKRTCGGGFTLDNTRLRPFLTELGKTYAQRNVHIDHLL